LPTKKVTTAHKTRRRRVEFLGFINGIIAANPGKDIHDLVAVDTIENALRSD
jgi:hypothetical protein